ncbi:hypothetical protein [uncultured Pseudomonas sp.]|uniref:hypothetical protein n=1 Tax=uncultured Pseudomonas sp. TaxID=114707 RepID=UPI0025F2B346|nr:hypothetical protein [uncultured Pseudomonas sp.]
MLDCIFIPIIQVTSGALEEIREKCCFETNINMEVQQDHLRVHNYTPKDVFELPYVAFLVAGDIAMIVQVDFWRHRVGSDKWEFQFAWHISGDVLGKIKDRLSGRHYFVGLSRAEFEDAFVDDDFTNSGAGQLKLSLNEAAKAVAAKFGVSSSNVKISVTN